MDQDKTTQAAVRHYEAMKRAQKKYYETHKEDILRKCREKYEEVRATQPPRHRGRPPKRVAEGSEEDASKTA
jgi:hypothetical protein